VARCLEVLLGQFDAVFPRRSKASNGSIGDTADTTRDFDHDKPAGLVLREIADFPDRLTGEGAGSNPNAGHRLIHRGSRSAYAMTASRCSPATFFAPGARTVPAATHGQAPRRG
jgi:hypothetical protein